MYLGRHYPRWEGKTEGYWCSLKPESVTKVPTFYYTITPVFEGQDDDEWYGMLLYSLRVVNPLNLKYPDTTNSGGENINFAEDADSQEELMEMLHALGAQTTFNPSLSMGYNFAVENANSLFSTHTRFHCNYWTASFSLYEIFVEGETPEESLARVKADHPVFEFIEASIVDSNDMTDGLLAGTMKFGQEVVDQMPEPLVNRGIEYVRRFREFLRYEGQVITEQMEVTHFNCETGAQHQCKYGNEPDVVWRGQMQGEDIFEQFMAGLKQESIQMNRTVLANYRELALNHHGDCRALMPMLTPAKDIILCWRPGPYQIHSVVICADGTMFIQADRMPRSAASAHIDGFKELKCSEQFDVNVLSKFITKGELIS